MPKTWKIAFLGALAIALILFAYTLRAIFLPLLVALILAYILNPILTWLEGKRVPRLASIAGIYALLAGMLALLAFWAVPKAFAEGKEFIQVTFTGDQAKIKRLEPHLRNWFGVSDPKQLLDKAIQNIRGHERELLKTGGTVAGAVLSFMTQSIGGLIAVFSFVALVPVYLFFLLKNLNPWWESFKHWIPRGYREGTLHTLGRIHRANASFFRGQLTISLLEGLIVFVGLTVFDVKFALLFGLMYAALSLVPFLGVVIGFTVTELFVLADTGEFGRTFFFVAGIFVLIQVLEGVLFQPLILGKETGLHPIAIILTLLVCGELLGFFGMLIAVPLASTAKILFEDYVWPMFTEVADLTRVRPKPEEPAKTV